MKKTVSTYWYCLLLRWNTPSQNFWTLFTTATIRQSCARVRVLAGAALGRDLLGVVALSDLLVVERSELAEPEPPPLDSTRDQDVDDDADDPEPAAAESEAARAARRGHGRR